MQGNIKHIVSGINNLLNYMYISSITSAASNLEPSELLITIVSFNDTITYIIYAEKIENIKKLEITDFRKFGMTALYDTVISIIQDFEQKTYEYINRGGDAIHSKINNEMYIVTDGVDNRSTCSMELAKSICDNAVKNGKWKITHYHNNFSELESDLVNTKKYNDQDPSEIESILENLTI